MRLLGVCCWAARLLWVFGGGSGSCLRLRRCLLCVCGLLVWILVLRGGVGCCVLFAFELGLHDCCLSVHCFVFRLGVLVCV